MSQTNGDCFQKNAVFEWDCALMRLSEINMMESDLTQTTKAGAAASKWRLLRRRHSFHILSALCDSVFAAFFFLSFSHDIRLFSPSNEDKQLRNETDLPQGV